MVSIDVPLSSISRVLESQRNSLIDRLRAQNSLLSEDNEKLRVDYETMQSKYNALEEQLRKKMSQMQEILEGKKLEEGEENADWSGNAQLCSYFCLLFILFSSLPHIPHWLVCYVFDVQFRINYMYIGSWGDWYFLNELTKQFCIIDCCCSCNVKEDGN